MVVGGYVHPSEDSSCHTWTELIWLERMLMYVRYLRHTVMLCIKQQTLLTKLPNCLS